MGGEPSNKAASGGVEAIPDHSVPSDTGSRWAQGGVDGVGVEGVVRSFHKLVCGFLQAYISR